MKVIERGHIYELDQLDVPDNVNINPETLTFVNRAKRSGHTKHPGTTCQEVLRALINRVEHLDEEIPWKANGELIQHLRMALILFEARALIRKTQKGQIKPEDIATDRTDGHFALMKTGR